MPYWTCQGCTRKTNFASRVKCFCGAKQPTTLLKKALEEHAAVVEAKGKAAEAAKAKRLRSKQGPKPQGQPPQPEWQERPGRGASDAAIYVAAQLDAYASNGGLGPQAVAGINKAVQDLYGQAGLGELKSQLEKRGIIEPRPQAERGPLGTAVGGQQAREEGVHAGERSADKAD